jgi:hypothetical protein
MALNFGAALGAAAKSGMDTYMAMEENERRKKELAFREAEAKWQEEQRNQERKLNEITSQTFGMGDTRVTGRDYTGVTGGIDTAEPALKTEAYTPQQKTADFKQRSLAAGIPLQKVTAVSSAQRAEKYAEREEMALGFNQQIRDEIAADPTNLGAVFKKHFQTLYNEGKLPGLGDGKTAEVVPMGTGGESIVLRDEKGKAVRTIPLTIDTIEAITKKWGDLMMRDANPANYWKSREEDLKARQVGVQEAELNEKMKAGLFSAQAKQALGAANASNAHAAVYGNMLTLAKENKAAGEAMKPFIEQFSALTPEEQQGSKGIALLTQGAAAAAKKTGDVTGIISALKKPDADTKITVNPDGTVTQGGNLYVPDPAKPGSYKPATGIGPSPLDKAIAEKLKNKTEAAPAAPAIPVSQPAAPAEDTTKYIRSKTPRGSYEYTVSPRGMTKAQWAELDATKK